MKVQLCPVTWVEADDALPHSLHECVRTGVHGWHECDCGLDLITAAVAS